MARRVTLHDPATAIKYLREDGGVILTNFSTIDDLEKVNADAAPFIDAIVKDVRPQNCGATHRRNRKGFIHHHDTACEKFPTTRNNEVYAAVRSKHYSSREVAPTTRIPSDNQSLPTYRIDPIQ